MKIVIADPFWIQAMGLARAIEQLAGVVECHVVADIGALQRLIAVHADCDFVFVDDTILIDDEEAIFARLRERAPNVAIGILVDETNRERVLKAIFFGATAIVQKSADEDTIRGTLEAFFKGQAAFPRGLLDAPPQARMPDSARDDHLQDNLTPREREVICHIGTGKTVAKIAAELQLSPHTVRVHVTRIMKKLDLRDRSSLTHYAVKRGATGGPGRSRAPLS